MKDNYVLIDYENIQPQVAELLAAPVFKVWVFLGLQQNKVKVDLLDLMQRKGADARIIRMQGSGRNALDFHMAYHLGQLVEANPGQYFHVLSKDADLDPLIAYLKSQNVQVARWASVADLPLIKPSAELASDDEKLSRMMAYLLSRGSQRPATLRTLLGSTAALFNPRLGDTECAQLLDQLEAMGFFLRDGSKIKYSLPDES